MLQALAPGPAATTPTPTASPATPPAERKVIVVTMWGGVEYENFKSALEQFEKETGIKVELIRQDRIRDYIMMQLAEGKPGFDVAVIPWPAFAVELAEKGLLMDVSDIVEDVKPDLVSPLLRRRRQVQRQVLRGPNQDVG